MPDGSLRVDFGDLAAARTPPLVAVSFFHRTLRARMQQSSIEKMTRWIFVCVVIPTAWMHEGCGTTKSFTATEQLLMSDAVDTSISRIDFRPLAGYRVFLDSTYLSSLANPRTLLVHSQYVISSLRQQMMAAGCYLVDSRDEAELICEARLGALGLDDHSVSYGIPANSFLSDTSSAVTGGARLPSFPELSVARKEVKSSASKVAVFAYTKDTRQPVWQSGLEVANSTARDTWVLGIGPFQKGTIYSNTRFAGGSLSEASVLPGEEEPSESRRGAVNFRERYQFSALQPPTSLTSSQAALPTQPVMPAGAEMTQPPQ